MRFHIISLFPEALDSYISSSILKRAIEDKKIKLNFYNIRDFAIANKKKKMSYAERRVDDRPYGGGPGMIIEALPVIRAIDKAINKILSKDKDFRDLKLKKIIPNRAFFEKKGIKIIFFSPAGKQFTNIEANNISKKYKEVIFICGRYEGIDCRIHKIFNMSHISVGPYIVTGGELPAMILIDAISRQVKGVLGEYCSLEEKRYASSNIYTRPESFSYKDKRYSVPRILLEGNHAKIEKWRKDKHEKEKRKF